MSKNSFLKTGINSCLWIIFSFLAFSLLNCTKSKSDSTLLGLFDAPVITAVLPQAGNPAISTPTHSFPATEVTIQGRNFSQVITNNQVLFSGVPAVLLSATSTEIKTSVPAGIKTGVLSLADTGKGGSCSSPDGRSGLFCSSTDFFVNCYAPYLDSYGSENAVNPGENVVVKYKKAMEIHAFKTNVTNSAVIRVSCLGDIVVSRFSQDCTQDYLSATGTTATPFEFNVTGTYTIQYFITSSLAGDCKIAVLY